MVLAVGAIFLLFAACVGVPIVLDRSFGVWFGFAGAVIAIACWVYLVRPMPGFLQGIIALAGLSALVTLLIIWLVRVIRHVAA